VRRSLDSQRRLGYRSRVSKDVYEQAVEETARTVETYLKLKKS
jgi:hypothetical protein